jgi:hypothetical protein
MHRLQRKGDCIYTSSSRASSLPLIPRRRVDFPALSVRLGLFTQSLLAHIDCQHNGFVKLAVQLMSEQLFLALLSSTVK